MKLLHFLVKQSLACTVYNIAVLFFYCRVIGFEAMGNTDDFSTELLEMILGKSGNVEKIFGLFLFSFFAVFRYCILVLIFIVSYIRGLHIIYLSWRLLQGSTSVQ